MCATVLQASEQVMFAVKASMHTHAPPALSTLGNAILLIIYACVLTSCRSFVPADAVRDAVARGTAGPLPSCRSVYL